jgi:hypothetical protein
MHALTQKPLQVATSISLPAFGDVAFTGSVVGATATPPTLKT